MSTSLEGEGLLREALAQEITFDDGSICIGGAPILKVYRADDFPCRDEEKSDEEHDAEIEALAAHVARLAEGARLDGTAPDGTSWRVRAKEFADVALRNAGEIGRLEVEAALSLRTPPAPEREGNGAASSKLGVWKTTTLRSGQPDLVQGRAWSSLRGEVGMFDTEAGAQAALGPPSAELLRLALIGLVRAVEDEFAIDAALHEAKEALDSPAALAPPALAEGEKGAERVALVATINSADKQDRGWLYASAEEIADAVIAAGWSLLAPPAAPKAEQGAVGAAEVEVGRWVYRRIERLMDAKPGTPEGDELAFLAAVAEHVEEYGEEACGDHPLAALSPKAESAPSAGELARKLCGYTAEGVYEQDKAFWDDEAASIAAMVAPTLLAERNSAQGEVERLRAELGEAKRALERIASDECAPRKVVNKGDAIESFDAYAPQLVAVRKIARAALLALSSANAGAILALLRQSGTADTLPSRPNGAMVGAEGWRPIESAPRNSPFLGYVDDQVRVVAWGKTSHIPMWCWCLADQGSEDFDLCTPTHWQPLPPPPSAPEPSS